VVYHSAKVCGVASGEVIQDNDIVAIGEQVLCHVAADKAGASGYQGLQLTFLPVWHVLGRESSM
jgi:hypothetical protein